MIIIVSKTMLTRILIKMRKMLARIIIDEDNAAENDDQSDGAGQIRRLWQPIKAFLLASAVILTDLIIMIMWALNKLMTIFRSASSSSYAL